MSTVLLRLSESLYRSSPKRGGIMAVKGDRVEERVYKSLWHVLIAGVGLWELRHHKTAAARVLATGLIAFHVDAAISDALDVPPLSRRILNLLRPEIHAKPANTRRAKSQSKKVQ